MGEHRVDGVLYVTEQSAPLWSVRRAPELGQEIKWDEPGGGVTHSLEHGAAIAEGTPGVRVSSLAPTADFYFRIVLHQNHTGWQSGRDKAYGQKMNALEMANIGNRVRQKINESLKEDGRG